MMNLVDLLKKSGFKATVVSREELADGIGTVAGLNFVKDQVFYSPEEAAQEAGFELKVSTGKIQARSEAEAVKIVTETAAKSGVKAIHVKATRFGNSNNWSIISKYIK